MRNTNKCIIPECYVDSCLVEVLLKADKDFVNHHKGNGKVANEMQENFSDCFCVGIIDEDKEQLDYLKFFIERKTTEYLKLWKHKDKHHYFIQIRPVIEKWCIKICREYNINMQSFDLPVELNALLKITKGESSRRDDRLIRLFKEMKFKKCQPVMDLKYWIEFLKENNYNTNLDLL